MTTVIRKINPTRSQTVLISAEPAAAFAQQTHRAGPRRRGGLPGWPKGTEVSAHRGHRGLRVSGSAPGFEEGTSHGDIVQVPGCSAIFVYILLRENDERYITYHKCNGFSLA